MRRQRVLTGRHCVEAEKKRLRDEHPRGGPGEVQPACTFWDVDKEEYADTGCDTLPPAFPPGGSSFEWDPAWLNGTFDGVDGSNTAATVTTATAMRWARTYTHPTLLAGCELVETKANNGDDASRVVGWRRLSSEHVCAMEDPGNDAKCFWRRESQQFEGCGCVMSAELFCACTHLTDFTASATFPKVNVLSAEDLLFTVEDVKNSITVLYIILGMFFSTLFLVAAGSSVHFVRAI